MNNVSSRRHISNIAEHLIQYYHNPKTPYFPKSHKISELDTDELAFLESIISLSDITGYSLDNCLNYLLQNDEKRNFALYLLASPFSIPVNGLLNGFSVFQLLFGYLSDAKSRFELFSPVVGLFQKGYLVKRSDLDFVSTFYHSIDSQTKLEIWCISRFAIKLETHVFIEAAFQNINVLYTIVSFKLKKPVGIGYPNLLGIANNAFLHYRQHGDIILHAMKKFEVYDETIKRDHKNSFKYRVEDFLKFKPIQDTAFNEVVFKIFPELK